MAAWMDAQVAHNSSASATLLCLPILNQVYSKQYNVTITTVLYS
jgi:hypothetical protein